MGPIRVQDGCVAVFTSTRLSSMIASLFLMFVAAGIIIASTVYGFGGIFPLLLIACGVGALFHTFLKRRAPEPF